MAEDVRTLESLLRCAGYQPGHLDSNKSIETAGIIPGILRETLPEVSGSADGELKYSMLSVYYNTSRKVPIMAAYNIDGSLPKPKIARLSTFDADPRVDSSFQLNTTFYDLIRKPEPIEFNVGHMASHNEMSWGGDALRQAQQTFFYTNSVPQVPKLNGGLWSKLESYIVDEVGDTKNKRISVFTGPMLHDTDPEYIKDRSFKIPLYFYKVVVFAHGNKLYATGFVMSQKKKLEHLGLVAPYQLEGFEKAVAVPASPFSDYKHREVFQLNLDLIEDYTGLRFDWDGVDRVVLPQEQHKLKRIAEMQDEVGAGGPEKMVPFVSGRRTNIILPD